MQLLKCFQICLFLSAASAFAEPTPQMEMTYIGKGSKLTVLRPINIPPGIVNAVTPGIDGKGVDIDPLNGNSKENIYGCSIEARTSSDIDREFPAGTIFEVVSTQWHKQEHWDNTKSTELHVELNLNHPTIKNVSCRKYNNTLTTIGEFEAYIRGTLLLEMSKVVIR